MGREVIRSGPVALKEGTEEEGAYTGTKDLCGELATYWVLQSWVLGRQVP